MTEVIKLLEYAEALGHQFYLEGDNLRITRGKHLPGYLKTHIVDHKQGLIESLRRDEQAQSIGFMVGISGLLYNQSVSRYSEAYIELIDNKWHAWRETYHKGRKKAISTKVIAEVNTFEEVIKKAERYLLYVNKMR
ncbi:hypothetical protein SH601_05520 [Gracilibacillus sp. S3-1-1]|uniref:Uncharacterized protein n=1 Tax=Gracilibacillus pellucidus TaxID=3095368 RepID=A0ACC6M3B9_9BACI|nr:hypothetical protein [Gracilibacillus sp. S3-1-1]MDX8045444.1 hypothetical protein [Gracilibacillus sp. S3-1-1]